jgi:predicted Zn-dependent peptidase
MSVELTRLKNGMRVVTDRMDSVETVSLGVWVDVGTRHEPKAINGVAHLLEHMAFKGTDAALGARHRRRDRGGRRPAQRLYRARAHRLLRQGAEGGSALAVDILADILQHSPSMRPSSSASAP